MKNRRFKDAVALFIFSIALINIGCGGTQTTNTNNNENKTTPGSSVAALPAVCTATYTDIALKRKAVEDYIMGQFKDKPHHPDLESQIGVRFFLSVVIRPKVPLSTDKVLVAFFGGGVIDKKNKKLFHEVADIFKDVLDTNCIARVVFVAPGEVLPSPNSLVAVADPAGFLWCDDPNVPCPGGICAPAGSCKDYLTPTRTSTPTPDPTSKIRAVSNSNSTSSSNSGSGSNSGKPTP